MARTRPLSSPDPDPHILGPDPSPAPPALSFSVVVAAAARLHASSPPVRLLTLFGVCPSPFLSSYLPLSFSASRLPRRPNSSRRRSHRHSFLLLFSRCRRPRSSPQPRTAARFPFFSLLFLRFPDLQPADAAYPRPPTTAAVQIHSPTSKSTAIVVVCLSLSLFETSRSLSLSLLDRSDRYATAAASLVSLRLFALRPPPPTSWRRLLPSFFSLPVVASLFVSLFSLSLSLSLPLDFTYKQQQQPHRPQSITAVPHSCGRCRRQTDPQSLCLSSVHTFLIVCLSLALPISPLSRLLTADNNSHHRLLFCGR